MAGIERIIPGHPNLMWRTGLGGWGYNSNDAYLCCADADGAHAGDILQLTLEQLYDILETTDVSSYPVDLHYKSPRFRVLALHEEGFRVEWCTRWASEGGVNTATIPYQELVEVIQIITGKPYTKSVRNKRTVETIMKEDKEFEELGAITMLDLE